MGRGFFFSNRRCATPPKQVWAPPSYMAEGGIGLKRKTLSLKFEIWKRYLIVF